MENTLFFSKNPSRIFQYPWGQLKNSTAFLSCADVYQGDGIGVSSKGLSLTDLVPERKVLVKVFKITDNTIQDTSLIFSLSHMPE